MVAHQALLDRSRRWQGGRRGRITGPAGSSRKSAEKGEME